MLRSVEEGLFQGAHHTDVRIMRKDAIFKRIFAKTV